MVTDFTLDVGNGKGLKLSAYSWKPEKKEDVKALMVIVHGIGEYANRYNEYAEYFSSQGIAVYSMDLRGHGNSTGKRGHTAPRNEIYKDIDSLCKKALTDYPNTPLFIYGHSMGGNIGLSHRLEGGIRPRGYVITSPWIILHNKMSKPAIFALRILSKIKPDILIKSKIDPSSLTSDHSQLLGDDPLYHNFISVKTGVDCFNYAEKILNTAHEDHGDLLLLHGSEDKICSVEGSRAFIKKAHSLCSFKEWENSRHELQHEKVREKVRETIKDWIFERI